MNILALTSVYPQPDDGEISATYTVQYFCEQWAKQGHNVIVIQNSSKFPNLFYKLPKNLSKKLASKTGFNIPKKESINSIKREENGVKIYRFPMYKIIPHSKFSKKEIKKQVKLICNTLEENQYTPDIIISHWLNPQIDIIEELKKIYNVRTSLVFHNDCNEKSIKKFNLNKKILNIDAIGCRSLKNSQEVKEMLNLNKTPFVCYSGVPDDIANRFANKPPKKKKNSFLYVGRLVEYKNVDKILIALEKTFPNKDFELKIVGTGGEFEKLTYLSKKLKIENNVLFLGQVDRKDVFKIMEESECFVMISNNETFGMVYIEAMAMGCITIASTGGGVDGIIKNNKNGFLSPQGDELELAKVLNKIKTLPESKKKNIQEEAIKSAIAFSDSKISEKYLENIKKW